MFKTEVGPEVPIRVGLVKVYEGLVRGLRRRGELMRWGRDAVPTGGGGCLRNPNVFCGALVTVLGKGGNGGMDVNGAVNADALGRSCGSDANRTPCRDVVASGSDGGSA